MTALYVIANEYRQQAEKLADLDLPPEVIADTLESLSGDLEVKAQAVACMVRNFEVAAAAIKEFERQQKERREAIEARADRLKAYLAKELDACGIEKIDGPGIRLSWRKSSAVVIDQPELIPAQYMRQKPPPAPEPDKTAIADAIKAGNEVAGAHVEQRRNLQIK